MKVRHKCPHFSTNANIVGGRVEASLGRESYQRLGPSTTKHNSFAQLYLQIYNNKIIFLLLGQKIYNIPWLCTHLMKCIPFIFLMKDCDYQEVPWLNTKIISSFCCYRLTPMQHNLMHQQQQKHIFLHDAQSKVSGLDSQIDSLKVTLVELQV